MSVKAKITISTPGKPKMIVTYTAAGIKEVNALCDAAKASGSEVVSCSIYCGELKKEVQE